MMQTYVIKKGSIRGSISIPPSKSQCLRAILFGALGKGKSLIHNFLDSPDVHAMVQACRHFGATVDLFPDKIEIHGTDGKIARAEDIIDVGNSGIVLRFCAAVGALSTNPIVLTGDRSIRYQRPMQPLLDGLAQLGVSAISLRDDGFAPVIIQGPLSSGKASIDGRDSQPVSALLIAASFIDGETELFVDQPGEKPWVNLTLNWLQRLGINYLRQDFEYFRLEGGASYEGFEYHVPGDLSTMAFPLAAALVTGCELTLKNVDLREPQGDKELIAIFQKMGAPIEIDLDKKTVHVKSKATLTGLSVDINSCIDALPTLAVVACFAEGETHIYNGAVARQKECDRIQCIANELRKMGATLQETFDGLIVQKSSLKGTQVNSWNDHRLAMALTVAGLGAEGETHIFPVDCISKTYPAFFSDFNRVGANMRAI